MRQKYKKLAMDIITSAEHKKTPIVITEQELLSIANTHAVEVDRRLIRHLNMCGIVVGTAEEKAAYEGQLDTEQIKAFLDELSAKLSACGLSERSVSTFVSLYRMELTLGLCPEIKFENIPSENCFKTLSEAQRILSSKRNLENIPPLEIHAYLKRSYEKVEQTKSAIQIHTGWTAQELDELFSTPEWLLIDDTSVHQFFAWLKDNYPEELAAQIFKKAGLLGLEETKNRLNGITDLLGREQCCEVINLDIKRHGGWLFYEKSQPVECIRYLIVEKGLSGEKVLEILYNQQDLFYHFNKSRKYGEAAFNQLINKYM